ncbi:MAG: adenylate/guanylate cyclase domain-containing protein [Candidatus Udaeobacter sp.]
MLSPEAASDVKFEIGHVLFIDIVGYSKLLINEQSEQIQKLKEIVRGTEQFRVAEAEGKLLRLPTGDGAALVFRTSPEAPVLCALEISKELKSYPDLHVRMGIHSGPVNEITDLNEQANIAGAGINIAQRIMDCGDAGHILLSRHVAEDLEHYPRWQPYLHPLGDCEVKHGLVMSVVNFYQDELGNPAAPQKFAKGTSTTGATAGPKRSGLCLRHWIIGILTGTALVFGILFFVKEHRMVVRPASNNATNEPAVATSAIPDKSIAVLPFDNLSRDPDNAYFCEGVQDEILTRLAKVADLKVISRTSTQHFKSTPDNLPQIARQLGVANVVEGSVQKSGDAVRVNVQLIKAASDSHLWAETFDRKLTDIFSVESEVARAIADQLRAKLSGEEEQVIAAKPTQNSAAYDAYLRGLSIERAEHGFDAAKRAGAAYAEAVRIDPSFALAWASLAIIRSRLYLYGVDATTNTAAATREAADKAMSLQPKLAEAWMAQAAYRYRVSRDFRGAVQAYEEASKRFPNSSQILTEWAVVETRLGTWDKAEVHWRKAMDLDPRNPGLLGTVATEFLSRLRRFPDAHALLDRVSEMSPDDQWIHVAKADLFLREGRLDETTKELAGIPADSLVDVVVSERALLLTWQRQFDSAIAIIERKINSAPPGEPLDEWNKILLMDAAYCQEWAGRPEQARSTFTRALHEINPSNDAVLAPKGFGMPVNLALTYAGLGEKDKALVQAHLAIEQYADDGWVKPDAEAALAQIQARFGDTDAAIAAIPHLLEVPAGITRADLRYDPLWDPLRKDPRFQKLCEEERR